MSNAIADSKVSLRSHVTHSSRAAVETSTRPVIECKNLWKIYGRYTRDALNAITTTNFVKDEVRAKYGCVVGVAGVSFEVKRGETLCVMGLSGCGKSTLLRHINRLIEPSAGEIWINGQNVSALANKDLRALRASQIGMVFQNMALWPHFTVLENVTFALHGRRKDRNAQMSAGHAALRAVRLDGWEEHYPDQLSGGMQQRVGLARALASGADILLMDEPFSALDPVVRREQGDQFTELTRRMGKTSVFITHDFEEAVRIGDRIAIMREGKIVQIGSPFEIINNPIDDYVRSFLQGISHLHAVTAESVMDTSRKDGAERWPSVSTREQLSTLIDRVRASSTPLAVRVEGTVVGTISADNLLAEVRSRLG